MSHQVHLWPFKKNFFSYRKIMKLKKKLGMQVEISFNSFCFSKSTRRLEPRGYEIEAPSTMKSVCYKRRHMPVSPPQWQMPHPKADRRHCSLYEKHNTQSQQDLVLSLKPERMLKYLFKSFSLKISSGLLFIQLRLLKHTFSEKQNKSLLTVSFKNPGLK